MGNDYTSHFSTPDFFSSCQLAPMGSIDPESLLEAALSSNSYLTSSNADYQHAIDFSIDLYECRDISSYSFDERNYQTVELMRLGHEMNTDIMRWFHDHAISLKRPLDGQVIGDFALEYLNAHQTKPELVVSEEALAALANMLRRLKEDSFKNTAGALKREVDTSLVKSLSWEGVVASTTFQNIIMAMAKVLSPSSLSSSSSVRNIDGAPMASYDGLLFYEYLSKNSRGVATPVKEEVCVVTSMLANLNIQSSPNPYLSKSASPASNGNSSQKSNVKWTGLLGLVSSTASAAVLSATSIGNVDENDDTKWAQEGGLSNTNPDELPIDLYRSEIIARVERDRVIIIHGETGYLSELH